MKKKKAEIKKEVPAAVKAEEPKKTLTIEYTPPKMELSVASLIQEMVEKHKIKHLLLLLHYALYYEGNAKCTMIMALMNEEEVNKVKECLDASDALMYLRRNWEHCVAEGQKIREEIERKL